MHVRVLEQSVINMEPPTPPPAARQDPEREKRLQLSAAYRSMTDMFAWKHLKEMVLERIHQQAVADEDALDMMDLNLGVIGECRGRRNAIKKILREVENILQPQI